MTDTLKPEPSEHMRIDIIQNRIYNIQTIKISDNTIAKYGINTENELKTKFQEIRTNLKED